MGARGIPADAFEIEQGFCSPSPLIKTCPLAVHKFRWRNQRFRASLILSLKMSVSGKATPSFFSLAAPSGITPTPLFQRLCAKGGCLPLWKPRRLCRKWVPTLAFRVATFPSNPQNKSGMSCQYMTAAPLCFVLRLPCAAGGNCRRAASIPSKNICDYFCFPGCLISQFEL